MGSPAANDLRSMPAQKALSPAPVSTMARTSGSVSAPTNDFPISRKRSRLSALRRSGRFIVSTRTPSRSARSSTICESCRMTDDLANSPLPADTVGLLEGLTTTRAIRRYLDEPVPPAALRAMLFAATRAPSGSNRQPFRMIVLTDGPKAKQAKELIATGARKVWSGKRSNDGYDQGSGV